ncbi:MAG: hypothetical protein U0X86_000646 [Wolbachia endosymbiont of Xenopsylla cheopis]
MREFYREKIDHSSIAYIDEAGIDKALPTEGLIRKQNMIKRVEHF